MNQKKLTITLQKLSIEEEDDDDTPSSGDIEVIHKFAPPKLHSILKQRTISESSDDYGLSPTSESPRSDEDLAKLNKSVSFNNHVDSASFHSSKCPQSVKITLHNKHKKQKKKENLKRRRQERQRHNSTGSECSSGDDISDGQSQSDTSLANEDFEKIKEECEDVSEEVAKLAHAISKGFAESPPSKTDTNNKCQLKTGGDSVKANGVAAEQPLDFRTSGGKKKRKNKGKSRGKKAYQGVSKGDKVSTTSTESEGNSDHKVESFDNTEKFNSQQVKKSVISSVDVEDTAEDIPGEGTEVCEEDTRVKTEAQTTAKNQKLNSKQASDELNGIMLESGSISKVGDLKKIVEQNDSSIVKIVAGGPSGDDSDDEMEGNTTSTQASTEHVTKCAFQFSNCVIYDLDND